MQVFFRVLVFWLIAAFSGCCIHSLPAPLMPKCPKTQVPVTGYAKAFVGSARIDAAKITILERKQNITTDQFGRFEFCAKPGEKLTLVLEKPGSTAYHNFHTTQSATFTITTTGLSGQHEITFQVPRITTYRLLETILKNKLHVVPQANRCIVATTITAAGKTLSDDEQGEVGAQILLTQAGVRLHPPVIYFGILFGKTNPFSLSPLGASKDGGTLIYNLPASHHLYTLSAYKPGLRFSQEQFLCRPGAFINLSPPHGPRVIRH